MHPERRPAKDGIAIRPATPGDAIYLERWRKETEVRRYQPLAESTVAQLYADLSQQRITDLYLGRGEKYQWIVEADTQPAGWITLVVTNWGHGLAEVGYALATAHQRRGVMPHALRTLLDELFSNSPLRRLEARCALENEASQRVLEAVRFRREGVLRDYFVLRGQPMDNYLYAILKDDWQRQ